MWFLTRAAAYAPPAAKDQIEKAAEYYYNKYHGGMDGFDQVKTLVTQSVLPPASYNPTPAPPPPSPADQAAKVVATTPDLKTLNLNDKEFILFNGKPEDAGKMWDTMKGQTYQIPGKVVSATPDSVQLAVTDDAKASNTADFTVNMKKPLTTPPAIGTRGDLRRHLRFLHTEPEDDHAHQRGAAGSGETGPAHNHNGDARLTRARVFHRARAAAMAALPLLCNRRPAVRMVDWRCHALCRPTQQARRISPADETRAGDVLGLRVAGTCPASSSSQRSPAGR